MTTAEGSERATALAELASRIERSPDAGPGSPAPVTGGLADLKTWWTTVGAGADLAPTRVTAGTADQTDPVAWLLLGAAEADRAIDAGATLVIPRVAARDDLAARAVIALLTKREANRVIGQSEGMSDDDWMQRCVRVRDRSAEAARHLGDYPALLSAVEAPAVAATAGVLLGAAARRTPCLIDGTDEWAAALVADRLSHASRTWWRAATTSPDPARTAAVERIGLEPGLPLDLTDDDGLGADATLAMLRLALASS